jgi:hypothetical protein
MRAFASHSRHQPKPKSLDFCHPAVATLIKQTLFHVGPILPADKCHSFPYPEWRTDLHIDANDELCTDLAGILRQTLMAFADDISEAKRDHRALLLIFNCCRLFFTMGRIL